VSINQQIIDMRASVKKQACISDPSNYNSKG